jgi:integrase
MALARSSVTDWDEWKAMLEVVGVRSVRVHDARHTAATLLLAQGVDQRVVMEILGHSQISMASRYAHVLPQVMTDAAERIGRALWGEPWAQLQPQLQPDWRQASGQMANRQVR